MGSEVVTMDRPEPRRAKELAAVGIICVLSIVGFVCAMFGFAALPYCRYGSEDCYFIVEACYYDYGFKQPATSVGSNIPTSDEQHCTKMSKFRAIEGSISSRVSEQVTIPVLAVVMACVPAIVTFISILWCPRYLALLEFAKYWLASSLIFLVLGIRVVQDLTFDCRWWGNQHHGNGKNCHDGLSLYVAAAILLLLGQIVLLAVSIYFIEARRFDLMKEL